jgi:hypothetical protein
VQGLGLTGGGSSLSSGSDSKERAWLVILLLLADGLVAEFCLRA